MENKEDETFITGIKKKAYDSVFNEEINVYFG